MQKDISSHTGDFMTMVTVCAYVQSNLKNNTKSSTESELVGVYDVLTQVIWTRYFLKEQVYDIRDNVIYQDKQSTRKLENNGRQSSIKQKIHINIRYYFITDRIMNQEASMEFCPALDIIRYSFAKSLQGYKFCRFRNIIIGIHEYYIPSYNTFVRSFLEEKKINYIGIKKRPSMLPNFQDTEATKECVGQN